MPYFTHPFPEATQWAEENLRDDDYATFLEYRYAVDYHLEQTEQAYNTCSSALYPGRDQVGVDQSGEWIYLWRYSADDVVRFGDTAIREAASVLDAGLQLTNYVLGNPCEAKKSVNWQKLRSALIALPKGLGANLKTTLQTIFGSIGYSSLKEYRNWVTHRGAPRVVVTGETAQGRFRMPEDARQATDERDRKWHVEKYVLTTVPNDVQIQCWPFVPPVGMVISEFVEDAAEDIDIPGIVHIGKGSKNITLNIAHAHGSLLDDAALFRSNNPIHRHMDQVRVAGEDLMVYTAFDYIYAVRSVVGLAKESLTGEWDQGIRDLWQQL